MRGHGHGPRRRTRTLGGRPAAVRPPDGTAPLALDAPFTLADNSFGAQTGAIDVSQWTWMGMGCRGLPTLGAVQARGGDRLSHLIDRAAPVLSCSVNGAVLVMNPVNDLSDPAVTNDAAGGDVLLARLDQLVAAIRVNRGRPVVARCPATVGALAKPHAVARYHEGLVQRAAALMMFDEAAAFDPTDPAHSWDGVHPNLARSARALGLARGRALASLFAPAELFSDGGQLRGNINANWNMATLGVLTNNSGAAASRSSGFLRSKPDIPCQILKLQGAVTADPTASGSTGDVQLRLATPHAAGASTYGKSVTCVAFIEVTDSNGDDPVGLASFQLQCALSGAFGKRHVPANGPWGDGKRYVGPIGIVRPVQINAQSIPMNTDFIIRGLQQAGVDVELRIAWVNVLYTDEVAYGPVVNASAPFTAGRPALFPPPTTTPASGALAAGGTLGVGATVATLLGGGVVRRYRVIRNGAVEVGDASPATATAAAAPYTVRAEDGGATLAVRTEGTNSWATGDAAKIASAALPVS